MFYNINKGLENRCALAYRGFEFLSLLWTDHTPPLPLERVAHHNLERIAFGGGKRTMSKLFLLTCKAIRMWVGIEMLTKVEE